MRKQPEMVEVVRSFSYKLQMERVNPLLKYESADFFCSQKTRCRPLDVEETSNRLYQFCKAEVTKSVAAVFAEAREKDARKQSDLAERKKQIQANWPPKEEEKAS